MMVGGGTTDPHPVTGLGVVLMWVQGLVPGLERGTDHPGSTSLQIVPVLLLGGW